MWYKLTEAHIDVIKAAVHAFNLTRIQHSYDPAWLTEKDVNALIASDEAIYDLLNENFFKSGIDE